MGKKISERHSIKRIQNEQSKKACRILYFPKFNLRDYRRAGRVAVSTIPVAYGGEHGPDLDEVAAFAHLSPGAVIERHYAPEYRVFMLGFLPGFTYMGTVDGPGGPVLQWPPREESGGRL